MAVTAKRDDMRLIAIVLGEQVSKVRNDETTELLDYGFNNYKVNLIKSKGEVVKKIKIDKGSSNEVEIVTQNDILVLNKKSDATVNYDIKVTVNEIELPVKKGTVIGKIEVLYNNKVIKSDNLIVSNDVEKINYFKYLFDNLKDIVNCSFF